MSGPDEERRTAVLAFWPTAQLAHHEGGLAVVADGVALSRVYPLGTSADLLWLSAHGALLRGVLTARLTTRRESRRVACQF